MLKNIKEMLNDEDAGPFVGIPMMDALSWKESNDVYDGYSR